MTSDADRTALADEIESLHSALVHCIRQYHPPQGRIEHTIEVAASHFLDLARRFRTHAPKPAGEVESLVVELDGFAQCVNGGVGDGSFRLYCEDGSSEQTGRNLRAVLREAATALTNLAAQNARLLRDCEILGEARSDECKAKLVAMANPDWRNRATAAEAALTRERERADKAEADKAELVDGMRAFSRVSEHDIGGDEANSDWFRPMSKHNRAPLLVIGDLRRAAELVTKHGGQG